jgi:hypothetical protein
MLGLAFNLISLFLGTFYALVLSLIPKDGVKP